MNFKTTVLVRRLCFSLVKWRSLAACLPLGTARFCVQSSAFMQQCWTPSTSNPIICSCRYAIIFPTYSTRVSIHLGFTSRNLYIKIFSSSSYSSVAFLSFSFSSVCTSISFGFYVLSVSSEDVQTMARCVMVCPSAGHPKTPMKGPIRRPGVSDED